MDDDVVEDKKIDTATTRSYKSYNNVIPSAYSKLKEN